MQLSDQSWKVKYTPEDGDLVAIFYIPALSCAARYDRLTGYFNAAALALAARGIDGLVRNRGRMRLVVGCTLAQAEIDAIRQGANVCDEVQKRLAERPLNPPDAASVSALELLAWMVAHDYLEIKVAVPCDERRRPIPSEGLFHEKSGILEDGAGGWMRIARDEAKRRFQAGGADVLLCTDAAAEGLNFQFCGALVNYDMPWNPMKVEQRIGRIDRLGQAHAVLRIVNLHYADTVEADVYQTLRERIGLFVNVVGKLQPILAHVPGIIAQRVLTPALIDPSAALDQEISSPAVSLDLDEIVDEEFSTAVSVESPLTLDDLDTLISQPDLLPPDVEAAPMQAREYRWTVPGAQAVRVTTDPEYYEQNADSVELWSPGNPVFPLVDDPSSTISPEETPLRDLFASRSRTAKPANS